MKIYIYLSNPSKELIVYMDDIQMCLSHWILNSLDKLVSPVFRISKTPITAAKETVPSVRRLNWMFLDEITFRRIVSLSRVTASTFNYQKIGRVWFWTRTDGGNFQFRVFRLTTSERRSKGATSTDQNNAKRPIWRKLKHKHANKPDSHFNATG